MRPRSNPGSDGTSADNSARSHATAAFASSVADESPRDRGSKADRCTDNRGVQFIERGSLKFVQCRSGCNDGSDRCPQTDDGSDRCGDNRGIVVQRIVQRFLVQRSSGWPHGYASTGEMR